MIALRQSIKLHIANQVIPSQYLDYRHYLGRVIAVLQSVHEDFTYDMFADFTTLSRGVIHHIIGGRRNLSVKNAERIASALALSNKEKKYFIGLIRYQHAKKPQDRDHYLNLLFRIKEQKLKTNINPDQLAFFRQWYTPIIHQMIDLPEFKPDPKWIAKQIAAPVTPKQVEKSLDLLLRLGLIKIDHTNGRYIRIDTVLKTQEGLADLLVIDYHKKMIALANAAVTVVPEKSRDINAMTLTLSAAGAHQAKREIYQMLVRLLEIEKSDGGGKKSVVQIGTQLFPLTKPFLSIHEDDA